MKHVIVSLLLVLIAGELFAPNISEDLKDKQIEITKMQEKEKFQEYLNAIAQKESSMNPDAINSIGAMGKYQFTKQALNFLGFDSITVNKFKKNPEIFPAEMQDQVMIELLKANKSILSDVIEKYSGTVQNGILITKSGILAAAHLAGAFGVKTYFQSDGLDNPSDMYGTSIKDYLKHFSGYSLNFILYKPLKES